MKKGGRKERGGEEATYWGGRKLVGRVKPTCRANVCHDNQTEAGRELAEKENRIGSKETKDSNEKESNILDTKSTPGFHKQQ